MHPVYKTGIYDYLFNKSKRKFLGIKKNILEKYGAVSEETAEKMAKGICDQTKADVSIAITGIAGPNGGTDEKPVGLVYMACCVNGKVTVKRVSLFGQQD